MIPLNRELLDRANHLPRIRQEWDYSGNGTELPVPLNEWRDGFTLIGSGCERTVWLGPDGYVYKVQADKEYSIANVREWRNCEKARQNPKLPEWIYVPECAYDEVTGIAVTEFIQGSQPWDCYNSSCTCEGECRWERANEAFNFLGSCDGHAGNCMIVDGNSPDDFVVAIIDFTR